MAKKQRSKEPSFEEAIERLEQLADELESGELKLEDAIRKYEEGVKLYARCQEILSKAEKKVQMLVRDTAGSLKAVPFEPDATDASDTSAAEAEDTPNAQDPKPRRSGSRKNADLF